jgi:hypothetical protein
VLREGMSPPDEGAECPEPPEGRGFDGGGDCGAPPAVEPPPPDELPPPDEPPPCGGFCPGQYPPEGDGYVMMPVPYQWP